MNLLIKGMEMPENCYLCRLGDQGLGIKCRIAGETYANLSNRPSSRPSWCPLIEVPTPHGRLIDEKWIKEYITDTIKGFEEMNRSDLQNYSLIAGLRTVEVMIEHAPTVIEAEEGENK